MEWLQVKVKTKRIVRCRLSRLKNLAKSPKMTIFPLLTPLAILQAVLRTSEYFLALIYTAFFFFAYLATSLDFTHSLLINSIFCLFLARYTSVYIDTVLGGVFIALQFIAVMNYACMAVFYSFLTKFYTQAITLYTSLNDLLIILNIAVLIGMTNGGRRLYSHA